MCDGWSIVIYFHRGSDIAPNTGWCDPFTRNRVTRGMGGKGRDTGQSRTLTTVCPFRCGEGTHTVMTRHTPGRTIDKAPRTEEPDKGKALTSGSEPTAGWATAPPTVTS
jgi:hypothetical protein